MVRRPLAACALLLAVYAGLSLLNDPRGYLGTDTGGKVATLEVMTERGRLDPDIGYWAERWDPAGRVHPLFYTSHIGRRWVNASTLPVLYAAYPLYALGGYRLALLLPMLGAVAAALAARALARRLGGGEGWRAFWLTGLASPMVIYALDFWEHSVGVAALAWAVVLLVDLVEDRRSWVVALPAGFLVGAAATVRTESLVYGLVAVGVACLVLLIGRRRLRAAIAVGALALVGLIVPLAANQALEVATVGNPVRTPRATGTASAAVATTDGVGGQRLQEAALNAVGLHPRLELGASLLGLALLGLLALGTVRGSADGDAGPAAIALGGAAALYALRFAVGPGFVPGLVAATPLVVVGLVYGWRTVAARYVLGVGLVSLPLVWATQFQGGAAPQWAGRYLLVTGLLCATVGVVALDRLRRWARVALVAMAVSVTGFGLVWMSIRTHAFGRVGQALAERSEPVLVSRVAHLAREGGSFYGDRRWLTADTDADQAFAVRVLEDAGVARFGLVTRFAVDEDPIVIPGWQVVGEDRMDLLNGIELSVTTYDARDRVPARPPA